MVVMRQFSQLQEFLPWLSRHRTQQTKIVNITDYSTHHKNILYAGLILFSPLDLLPVMPSPPTFAGKEFKGVKLYDYAQ